MQKSKTNKSFGKVKRCHDWPERFDALIERSRNRKFEWGKHDCMTFAVEVLDSVGIDHDLIKDFRGKYKTAKEAKNIFEAQKDGFKGLASELLQDYPQLHLRSGKRGDLVLVSYDEKLVMGVVLGVDAAVLGSDGLEFISISHAKIVWGIGHK